MVRNNLWRALFALIAMVVVVGLVAACGGDDGDAGEGAVVTVTERVNGDTPPSDLDANGGDSTRPSDEELDQAIQVYQQFFGFSEEQSRCVITRAMDLSEANIDDPSAFITAGGLQIFQDCGIDLADFASRFGGQP